MSPSIMNVSSLLNPLGDRRRSSSNFRRLRTSVRDATVPPSPIESIELTPIAHSGTKDAKDAPKFVRGEPVGDVQYPVYYPTSQSLRREIKRYAIYPESCIESYPRHIPYNSDKKRFAAKTGREALEVFQYIFRYQEVSNEGDDKRKHDKHPWWTVMWDYNIGLVRITPFFKAQDYGKTVPAKVIAQNPGLTELCHSITGGSIVAQGYWMPFEAAKAIAATFCWKIRFALVPMFGPAFVDLCTHPSDPAYKRFTIDSTLVKRCARETNNRQRGKVHHRGSRQDRRPYAHSPLPSTAEAAAAAVAVPSRYRPLRPRRSRQALDDYDRGQEGAEEEDQYMTPEPTSSPYEDDVFLTPASLEETPQIEGSRTCTPIDGQWAQANGRLQKRAITETETDNDIAAPIQTVPPTKRKRKVGQFTADEARAAYQLLELRYS